VVAELELNSVNPPPDTFEEKQNKPRILKANNLNGKPIRATVNSKREISNAKHITKTLKGYTEFGPSSVNLLNNVDS
jgi:hypothetical protein